MPKTSFLAFSVIGALSFFVIGCEDQPAPQTAVIAETKAECADTAVPNSFVIRWKNGSHSVARGWTKEDFEREIFEPNKNEIAFVEQDQKVRVLPASDTKDSEAFSTTPKDDWGQTMVDANDAWAKGARGKGVIVAVVDTGADVTHPQLQEQLAVNAAEVAGNGIDDDGNGLIDDVNGWDFLEDIGMVGDPAGHGTHVSGIIVADHAKGPVLGLAPDAKLLPIRFLSEDGDGIIGDAILGIEYAVSRGAKVINASWGGKPCSKSLKKTISELAAKGVLFVAAAGNSGADLDQSPEYPGAFDLSGQITVGASTSRDYSADFSNFSFNLVHLFAPGAQIMSTWPGNRSVAISGTSMATPFVSAAAAILFGYKPDATVAQVRSALIGSVDKGGFAATSRGRLNIRRALDML